MTTIIIVLIIITFVTIFSVQNATPVSIAFLFWRFDASLAIVLFLSVLGGGLTTLLVVYSLYLKRSYKNKKMPGRSDTTDEDHLTQ